MRSEKSIFNNTQRQFVSTNKNNCKQIQTKARKIRSEREEENGFHNEMKFIDTSIRWRLCTSSRLSMMIDKRRWRSHWEIEKINISQQRAVSFHFNSLCIAVTLHSFALLTAFQYISIHDNQEIAMGYCY